MWNRKKVCKKCDAVICKYDKDNTYHDYRKAMKICPYCGEELVEEYFSPDF